MKTFLIMTSLFVFFGCSTTSEKKDGDQSAKVDRLPQSFEYSSNRR